LLNRQGAFQIRRSSSGSLHANGDSGGLDLRGEAGENAVAELTGPLEVLGGEGEAEALRIWPLVNRDLAPPGPVVVGEVVVGVGRSCFAGEADSWLSLDGLAHDTGFR
jgi:hypothetical protein